LSTLYCYRFSDFVVVVVVDVHQRHLANGDFFFRQMLFFVLLLPITQTVATAAATISRESKCCIEKKEKMSDNENLHGQFF
jgi:hypothetical protein